MRSFTRIGLGLGLGRRGVYGRGGGARIPLQPFNASRAIPLNLMNSGASHTNLVMPVYIDAIAEYFGSPGDVESRISVINGSTWAFRWENDESAQGESARLAVEDGTPDVLAICDISNSSFDEATVTSGGLWRDACEASEVEMYAWALQYVLDSGLEGYEDPLDVPDVIWGVVRDKQNLRNSGWKGVVEEMRDESSNPLAAQIRFIPWASVLAAIITGWLNDEAPAGFRPEQMLGDVGQPVDWWDNHPSALGRWCIALTHFCVIWRRSPLDVPLPHSLGIDTTGNNAILAETSEATYAWLAGIIWEVCQMEPRTGIRQWEWILESAAWNDAGTWEDTSLWKDAA